MIRALSICILLVSKLTFLLSFNSITNIFRYSKTQVRVYNMVNDESDILYVPIDDDGLIGYDGLPSNDVSLINIPIWLDESPLLPFSKEFLFIYEMRFRSLFNDAEKHGHKLGWAYQTEDGKIAEIGTLCNIIEKKKLENGKGFYVVQGCSRFRVRQILSTEPYLSAQVEIIHDDSDTQQQQVVIVDVTEEDVLGIGAINEQQEQQQQQQQQHSKETESLCQSVYSDLKAYMRISKMLNSEDEEDAGAIFLSTTLRDNRPPPPSGRSTNYTSATSEISSSSTAPSSLPLLTTSIRDKFQPTVFSFAVAGQLILEPATMQRFIQTQSIKYRLTRLRKIIRAAMVEITDSLSTPTSSSPLGDAKLVYQKNWIKSILRVSASGDDNDEDLLPPIGYRGLTIDSELLEIEDMEVEDLQDLAVTSEDLSLIRKLLAGEDQHYESATSGSGNGSGSIDPNYEMFKAQKLQRQPQSSDSGGSGSGGTDSPSPTNDLFDSDYVLQ